MHSCVCWSLRVCVRVCECWRMYVKCVHILGLVGLTITRKQHGQKHVEAKELVSEWAAGDVPPKQPVASHQADNGQSNWTLGLSMRVGVCVSRCVRQAIVNAVLQFTFLVFCFLSCVFRLLPLHFTHNFAIILVSNVCNFIFHHSTRFCCCYMLHATCHHRNFELSSFFRLQPPIGTSSPIGFHTTEGADAACLSALFHLSFIFIDVQKKNGGKQKPYGASSYRLCLTSWTKNLTNASR